ncbi:MAG: metalloregulator ArsR/SmtB family transcription factor [Bryocella sp.]
MSVKPLDGSMLDAVAARFRVLGEPFRLRLLQELQGGPKTVTELVERLEGGQPNVSKHLRLLFDAGLVRRVRQGNSIHYSIGDPVVFELCELVCGGEAKKSKTVYEQWAGLSIAEARGKAISSKPTATKKRSPAKKRSATKKRNAATTQRASNKRSAVQQSAKGVRERGDAQSPSGKRRRTR